MNKNTSQVVGHVAETYAGYGSVWNGSETVYPARLLVSLPVGTELYTKSLQDTTLAELVLDWWEDHQYDTDDSGEYNTYSCDPKFVMKAKEIMGLV